MKKTDWLSILVTLVVLVWIVGVTLVVQTGALFVAASATEIFRRADMNATQIYLGAAVAQVEQAPLSPVVDVHRARRRPVQAEEIVVRTHRNREPNALEAPRDAATPPSVYAAPGASSER